MDFRAVFTNRLLLNAVTTTDNSGGMSLGGMMHCLRPDLKKVSLEPAVRPCPLIASGFVWPLAPSLHAEERHPIPILDNRWNLVFRKFDDSKVRVGGGCGSKADEDS